MSDTPTDQDLLYRTTRGDEEAFMLLYHRHRDTVFRFAFRMLGSAEPAEDVTHDCFLSLIRHPRRFDGSRASLRTYLCAAARNLILKRFRGTAKQTSLDELSEGIFVSTKAGPLDDLLDKELSTLVRAALGTLSPLQREALILFEYENMTLLEIAAIVSADVGTVKARLHRGREQLRKLLAPYARSNSDEIVLERCQR
jgi:RNA polymerase sigma-70 factor (ECF subfamily)